VIGVSAALFTPAENASLPDIVPDEQVRSALAMNAARASLARLGGTGVGGFLYAIGRVVPFAVDTVSHCLAFFALSFVRLPPREVQRQPIRRLHREMAEGMRWVWEERTIRVTSLCAVVLNLFFSAFYIILIVLAHRRGIPPGEIGVMVAMLGAGGLVGALLAPSLAEKISPFVSIASVFWILSVLSPAAVFIHNGYLLGVLIFAMALMPPTANATITARQLLMTPDGLAGPAQRGTWPHDRGRGGGGPDAGRCAGRVRLRKRCGPYLRGWHGGYHGAGHGEPDTAPVSPEREAGRWPSGRRRWRIRATTELAIRTERRNEMDDDARYEVLRNDEDQYSLWLAGHEIPAGWYQVGKEGTKDECSAYVDEVWTDMRPRSLRERMDAEARP